jgi:xanthine dehydrogenase accessory factor
MADLFVMKKVLEEVEKGKEAAIATITKAKGSTPRGIGATMAVIEDSTAYGTVGGGSLEKKVIELCYEAIEEGNSYSITLPLHEEGIEMICGGEVDVFIDVYRGKPKLLIVGGGHVGYAIYELASLLDFHIVIFEDREEFLDKDRFPLAHDLVYGNIKERLENYPIDNNTYIVIVTRGHKYDQESLEAVVNSSAKYIGVMGSKKKVITMMESLEDKGIDREKLDKVYSPIGLKIDDGTPAEIAFSIIAEILLIKNNGGFSHLKDSLK